MKKWIEHHKQRKTLMECNRRCECDYLMRCINFSSHPIAEQVDVDWRCNICGIILKLRYSDNREKGIIVTKRDEK